MHAPDPRQHRFADVNGLRFHYVEAGVAPGRPLVLLLHGFPEFWYAWRHQLPALAAAGFHAVAPDLRGYNLSDKPPNVGDYGMAHLVADVVALARHLGHGRFHLVGHDWGGVVAFFTAMAHPRSVDRLVVLNAPPPMTYLRELRRPKQAMASWYAFGFQAPWLPEAVLRAGRFAVLRRMLRTEPARSGAFTREDVARYVEAWSRPGALRAGVNYYRAAFRTPPSRWQTVVRAIASPTLVIWGDRDRYLIPRLLHGLDAWVPDLLVERLPGATHWVQHDEPERVSGLIVRFLAGAPNNPAGRA